MDRVEQYRKTAEECRAMAARAQVQKHTDRWLRIAALWESLAEDAEKDPGRNIRLVPDQSELQAAPDRFLAKSVLSRFSDEENSPLQPTDR